MPSQGQTMKINPSDQHLPYRNAQMPWCWVAPPSATQCPAGHSGWVVRRGESQAAHHSQGCPLGDSVTGWLKLRGVFQCATAEVLDPSGETSKCDACDGKGVVIQAGMCVRMYWCFFILAAFLSGFLKAFSATFCTEPCSSSSHLLSLGGGSENGPNSQTGNGVIVSYMCRSLRKATSRVVMCFNDWNQSESVVWVHFASLQVQTLTDPMPEQVQQTCEKCGGKGYAPKMQSVREAIGQFWDTRPRHFLW